MSAQTKMQPDPVERLKRALDRGSWDYEFLARYVQELELDGSEEFIFVRLAFEGAGSDGAHQWNAVIVSDMHSEWYVPISADRKPEVRRWWHERARTQAEQFEDLRARLSNLVGLRFDPVAEILIAYPFSGQPNCKIRVPSQAMVQGDGFVKGRVEGWYKHHDKPQPGTIDRTIPEHQFDPKMFQFEA